MELPVRVTILGDRTISFDSAIVTLNSRGLSLRTAGPVPLRSALKIESVNQLWMGETIDVRLEGQAWLAAVRIDHALRDLSDLTRLANRFLGKIEQDDERRPIEKRSSQGLPAAPRAVP